MYTEEFSSFTWNRRNSELKKTVEQRVSFLTVQGEEVEARCTCCFTYCTARATKQTAADQVRTIVPYHQNTGIGFATERQGTQHHCKPDVPVTLVWTGN